MLKWREDYYPKKYPQPKDIFLLIEIVDSIVKYDREVKIPLYAKNRISEVWLIDLNKELIEVYWNIVGTIYKKKEQFFRGDRLIIQAFDNMSLTVDRILG